MNLNPTTIDRIVANVLSQLSPSENNTSSKVVNGENPVPDSVTRLSEAVITAELLQPIQSDSIEVSTTAIITPAAFDLIRERRLKIGKAKVSSNSTNSTNKDVSAKKLSIAIVRHTEAVDRALEDLDPHNQELVSCPDDAAKFAISEICRGEAATVLIFAEQLHRAACLANRNTKVKAVIVHDQGDVAAIRKQLRANVWCLDPTDRSYFELRNVLKAINPQP